MSNGIWTPQQQQQAEIGIAINDLGANQTLLIISAGLTAFQLATGPLESIEALANMILTSAKQVRAKRAALAVTMADERPITTCT